MTGRPYIVLRLKKGWAYDRPARRFVRKSEEFRPRTDLPKYTRILFHVPALAKKRKRTSPEDELARMMQILPPKGTRLKPLLKRVQAWPCVEKAWEAPSPVPAKSGGLF